MGEALIRGFCKSGVSSVEQISASVRSFERQRALSSLGLRVYGNALEGGAADIAANSEIIFLGASAIHPRTDMLCLGVMHIAGYIAHGCHCAAFTPLWCC